MVDGIFLWRHGLKHSVALDNQRARFNAGSMWRRGVTKTRLNILAHCYVYCYRWKMKIAMSEVKGEQ